FAIETSWREDRPRVRVSKYGLAASIVGSSREARLEDRSLVPDVAYTYPYSHRPLVEFMVGIPAEELSAPGAIRSLMRRAFDGLVPDRVLHRASKGYYPPAMMRAVRARAAAFVAVDRLEIVQRGWIDGPRLATAIRRLSEGNI